MSEKISRLPISDAIAIMDERHYKSKKERKKLDIYSAGDGWVVAESGKQPEIDLIHMDQYTRHKHLDYDSVSVETKGETVDTSYKITSGLHYLAEKEDEPINGTTVEITRRDKDGELVYGHTSNNPEFAQRLAEVAAKRVVRVAENGGYERIRGKVNVYGPVVDI